MRARLALLGLSTALLGLLGCRDYAPLEDPSYESVVRASRPIAYYRLDEPSGLEVVDAVSLVYGVYHEPIMRSLPSLVGGDEGSAVGLIMESRITSGVIVDVHRCTLEVLYQVASGSSFPAGIFHAEEFEKTGFRVAVNKHGGVMVWSSQSGGKVSADLDVAGPVLPDAPHHVAVAMDGENVAVYIDGAPFSSRTFDIISTDEKVNIGQIPGEPSIDTVDEVAIYGRPLSVDEIAAHAAAWKSGH